MAVGGRGILLLGVSVRARKGSRQLVGGLRQDAADEPLARLAESINEVVLWRRREEGRRGGGGSVVKDNYKYPQIAWCL